MAGVMLRVSRSERGYEVTPISTVGIFPCVGAIDREADDTVARALAAGEFESIKSVRRDDHAPGRKLLVARRKVILIKAETEVKARFSTVIIAPGESCFRGLSRFIG